MEQTSVISAKDLSIVYDKIPVVDGISFDVEKGDILAVVGPNGSGKSTLVKALLGLITPDSGSITVLGTSPRGARAKVGYVPQQFSFDRTFPITVMEFLRVSCPNCTDERISEYLKHLNIEGLQSSRLGSLSGGQLQRVLIVRAMLTDPEILYLDEPATGIDVSGEENFFSLISHLHELHHMTIVMVSHEIDVVYKLATQVLCINKSLVCSGTPEQALTHETLKKLYGSDAGVFHHTGRHQHSK